MKNFITALALTVCMSTLALGAEPIKYVPTPGESATVVSPTQEDGPIRFSVEIFPKEIYLGDTIYFVAYFENLSDSDIALDALEYSKIQFSLSKSSISSTYRWIREYRAAVMQVLDSPRVTIKPGERYAVKEGVLEFPPLEDWNDLFWRAFRQEIIPREGAACNIHIEYKYFDNVTEKGGRWSLKHEVLVKQRPREETALLEQWHNDTPETFFPMIDKGRKVPYINSWLDMKGRSDITVNGKEYNPWMFIRFGNRKPSIPNNPTTLGDWRELEASLVPSTMRDEVRLTRLQLEYYSA